MYLHITTRILTGGMPQLTHFKGVRPEHSRLQPSMFKNKPDIHTLSERCVCHLASSDPQEVGEGILSTKIGA